MWNIFTLTRMSSVSCNTAHTSLNTFKAHHGVRVQQKAAQQIPRNYIKLWVNYLRNCAAVEHSPWISYRKKVNSVKRKQERNIYKFIEEVLKNLKLYLLLFLLWGHSLMTSMKNVIFWLSLLLKFLLHSYRPPRST